MTGGVGSALVRAWLQRCGELGFGAVVVLGHPAYYPRFGFQPSICFGITSEYDAPTHSWLWSCGPTTFAAPPVPFAFCWFLTRFQIIPEERALLATFGQDFAQYTAKVRRWI